jgi:SAM-dependent methyltransferase
MQPKPEHFGAPFAEAFKDQRVVDAYRYRLPYPDEVFDILAGLITDEPRAVLDVGTGSGDIARHLVDVASRVDAVDFSLPMIEMGKQLPNGNHPHLHWIYGKFEDVPLTPPYALITAGSSIHWTEWRVSFPRFRSLLTPKGTLALIYRRALPMPWDADLRKLRAGFSERQTRRPTDTVAELKTRGYFHVQGEKQTGPVPFFQSVEDFIVGLHSRSSFSVERMGEPRATEFDQQVRSLLAQFHSDGMLPLKVTATVTWGLPGSGMVEETN